MSDELNTLLNSSLSTQHSVLSTHHSSLFLVRRATWRARSDESNFGATVLDAPDFCIGREWIGRAHAVGLNARAVNACRSEAGCQRASAILRQLLQHAFVAAVVRVGFNHYLVIRIVGEQGGQRLKF